MAGKPKEEERNPRPWMQISVIEALEEKHRFLDCRFYDSCLDIVISLHWDSFTCKYCKIFKQRRLEL